MDNGSPWGSRGDLPTDLVCWLAGLGVEVVANPPRRPQANGVVERSQGIAKRWAEPWACGTAAELQERLDRLDLLQRESYPSVGTRSRMEAFPGLSHSGRPFEPGEEAGSWGLSRVWELLGKHLVPRRVDRQGKLSVYNRPHAVSLAWAGQVVWVGFDAVSGSWSFQDGAGHEIRREVAAELTQASVMAMEVTYRRKGAHAAKPSAPLPGAQPTNR